MKCKYIMLAVLLFYSLPAHTQASEVQDIHQRIHLIKDSISYTDALNRLSMLLYERNIDSTFFYAARAREIAQRHGYEKGKADALNNLGIFFDIKGNLQLGLRYYDQAYSMYENLNDTSNQVQVLMNIAMVYTSMGKHDRSVQRFEAALKLGEKLSHDSIMGLAIYNYLLVYPQNFTREQRVVQIAKAKAITARYNDETAHVVIDQLIADDLIANGERVKGLALLDSAIRFALDHKLYYASMDLLIGMGGHLMSEDPKRTVTYYELALGLATKHSYLIYSQQIARKLFELYIKLKDDKQAVRYTHLLISLHEEQEKLDNSSGIDYLDYAIQEQEIQTLATRSRYQAMLLALAVLLCLFAILVIILIRRTLKRTRKLNAQVSEQNRQMRKALAALEQSQTENTRIMKVVAHDLRSPIGAITSATQLLKQTKSRSADEQMLLEMIETSGNNSLELVSDLLMVQTTGEDMLKEPIELDQLLQYCVDILENKATAKGQRIELRSIPLEIMANRGKLWRVVSNLLSNAIKFSPEGETIFVSLERNGDKARIVVKDHGIGIDDKLGDQIFDMFTKARRRGTAGEQTYGLGLSISKQIMEAHGGSIWFERNIEGGTTFFAELPL